ncbi:DUF899 family protein [Amycolatopsis plumensis]|uniref:DUF899 family protein n=1 Tax=Amycolatopsis plumensis TaxID=236508 RepID=A0ABV5U7Z9_9PSEU
MFDGHRRLVAHHTVPDRSRPAAVASAEELPAALHTRDTRLVIVSHAPYPKIEQYRRHFGWDLPVYSAPDTGFAADFPATRRLEGAGPGEHDDDGPGPSFFRQDGRSLLHTGSIAAPYLDFLAPAGVARGRAAADEADRTFGRSRTHGGTATLRRLCRSSPIPPQSRPNGLVTTVPCSTGAAYSRAGLVIRADGMR